MNRIFYPIAAVAASLTLLACTKPQPPQSLNSEPDLAEKISKGEKIDFKEVIPKTEPEKK